MLFVSPLKRFSNGFRLILALLGRDGGHFNRWNGGGQVANAPFRRHGVIAPSRSKRAFFLRLPPSLLQNL